MKNLNKDQSDEKSWNYLIEQVQTIIPDLDRPINNNNLNNNLNNNHTDSFVIEDSMYLNNMSENSTDSLISTESVHLNSVSNDDGDNDGADDHKYRAKVAVDGTRDVVGDGIKRRALTELERLPV